MSLLLYVRNLIAYWPQLCVPYYVEIIIGSDKYNHTSNSCVKNKHVLAALHQDFLFWVLFNIFQLALHQLCGNSTLSLTVS